jgi:glycosyltransferase involved in cell wall biosynthesis
VLYRRSWEQRDRVLAGDFDVVHVHASTMSPMAFLTAGSATRLGIPTVITVHSLWAYASPIFKVADTALQWRKWPLTWSAVSSAAVEPLRRMLPDSTPIAVLPNGVDASSWQIDRRPSRPDRIVVTSVMRLVARKRPRPYLAMLRAARAQVPASIRMEAVIVGDGPQRGVLERTINRHRLDGWVTLAGMADHSQIKRIYEDTDLYVAPALLESFGIAALEARCAGLPVVAHAGSGVRDFIDHNSSGMLAEGDDDMAACIARLAQSPTELARICEYNRTHRPNVSWSDVLDGCDALYDHARSTARHQRLTV